SGSPRPDARFRGRGGTGVRPVVLVLKLGLAFLPPGIQIQLVCENRALLALRQPPDRQTQILLPALNGPDLLIKISRNLLPGVETVIGEPVVQGPVLCGHPRLCPAPTHSSCSPTTRACGMAQEYRSYLFESNPVVGIKEQGKDCAARDCVWGRIVWGRPPRPSSEAK